MKNLIDQYLQSLGVNEPQISLAWLQSLLTAHLARYPFSSANVILKHDLSLEPEALLKRLVEQRRGGYCFEHNKVVFLVLKQLGFDVRPLIGRVMLNGNPDNGRSHRLTLLTLQNKQYLIDAGFGVMNPRQIIALDTNQPQPDVRYQYSVESDNRGGMMVMATNRDEAVTLYRFDFAEYVESDCNIGHFYSHQAPEAAFVNHLVVSRILDNRRYLVRNLTYFDYDDQAGQERAVDISDATMLYQLLTTQFNLQLTEQDAATLFSHQKAKLSQQQK
ncbi:arylamine N-acetyltransferase family protein [Photobacterium halotolerans]|uniref:N-hydroxyarylamine O-acetyltransferase n=1 Tax=Photobacterium halotolerans TaxID=265726 RepID=A0A0F5VB11_9GAMM|nr:arylamine N-acetyltransferase [Photobacterium halotolerans]KKC99308.1 hypothetical protein KY46_13040 [Photobacterium halotolerans]